VLPVLERESGLRVREGFNLAFSHERVDPGCKGVTTGDVPKVVGGITPACTDRTEALYSTAIAAVHPLTSPEAAELTKLLENIFRSVNIALVNELAHIDDISSDALARLALAAADPLDPIGGDVDDDDARAGEDEASASGSPT
jgi:UDP-N-acetyl-D-mannosaminuronate dehydrogenase